MAKKLLLSLASIVLCLAAIEVVFRLGDEPTWYETIEDEQFLHQQHDYRQNRWKLRDQDYEVPPPAGHYRILFLGDSFTFGTGVDDDSRLFVETLERRFNEAPPDPAVRRYDLLNAGIPGSLTERWQEVLTALGPRFQPDRVVAVFFLRDGTTLGLRRDFFNPTRERMQQWRQSSPLARISATWRILRGRFLMQDASDEYIAEFHRQYFGDAEQTREWAAARERLTEMAALCRQRNIAFDLVVFPVLFELGPEYPFRDICEEVERFGAEAGIPTFSLLPVFETQRAEDLWVSLLDQHPNADGHRIAADALEGYLRPLLQP